MEQKLYYLAISCDEDMEMNFPQNLQDLLDAGWRIIQISAFSFTARYSEERCVLLLQREKEV